MRAKRTSDVDFDEAVGLEKGSTRRMPQNLTRAKLDVQTLFEQCKKDLAQELSLFIYRGHIAPLRPIAVDGDVWTLACTSSFQLQSVETHYAAIIRSKLERTLGTRAQLRFVVTQEGQDCDKHRRETLRLSGVETRSIQEAPTAAKQKTRRPKVREPSYQNETWLPEQGEKGVKQSPALDFRRFLPSHWVKHEGNESTIKIIRRIVTLLSSPGESNDRAHANLPASLLLCGESGTGKSELLESCLASAKGLGLKNCVRINARQWVRAFVDALRSGGLANFQHRWFRQYDALFIDDVDFLLAKEQSASALLQLIESQEKISFPILLTTSSPLAHLRGLPPRFLRRLQASLTLDLRPPSEETMTVYFENALKGLGLDTDAEALELLTLQSHNSFSFADALITKARLSMLDCMNVKAARELLGSSLWTAKEPSFTEVLKLICETFGIQEVDLISSSRLKQLVRCRTILVYLAHRYSNLSFRDLGHRMNRDASTLHHGFHKAKKRRQEDISFNADIRSLERKLLGC